MQLTSGSSILRSGIWGHGFTDWICLEACTISQAGRSFTVNKFWLRLNCKITRCPLCLSFSLQPLPAFVVFQKKSNLHPVLPSPIYLSVCHLSISIYLHIYIFIYLLLYKYPALAQWSPPLKIRTVLTYFSHQNEGQESFILVFFWEW